MIKIYYHSSCTSSKKVFEWIEKYNISAEKIKIKGITKKDLIQVLSLTDYGIREIIKQQSSDEETNKRIKILYSMHFNSAIDYLLEHRDLLRTPILLDQNKYMIGYHMDDIRQFIPDSYRKREYYH